MDKDVWRDLWPLILKSPIALAAFISTVLMGYGISFLIFDYRTNPKGISHLLHIVVGASYTCVIFVITAWPVLFSSNDNPLTLNDLAKYFPRTMVISFAILFFVMITVIILRERKRGQGGQA